MTRMKPPQPDITDSSRNIGIAARGSGSLRTVMESATTGGMILALFALIVVTGLAMALRPERFTSIVVRNSVIRLTERFIRHYTLSVRIVGIGWDSVRRISACRRAPGHVAHPLLSRVSGLFRPRSQPRATDRSRPSFQPLYAPVHSCYAVVAFPTRKGEPGPTP